MVVLKFINKKFVRYFLPTFIWAVLIFALSSIPGNKIPHIVSYQNILFHIIEYAIFGWLINQTLKNYYPNLNRLNCIYLTILISLIYAIGDEFHQAFVPFRDASILDVSLDTIGAMIGVSVFAGRKDK